eukprot:674778-Prymnesium_polylepis.1
MNMNMNMDMDMNMNMTAWYSCTCGGRSARGHPCASRCSPTGRIAVNSRARRGVGLQITTNPRSYTSSHTSQVWRSPRPRAPRWVVWVADTVTRSPRLTTA